MFNPLEVPELIGVLGDALEMAARSTTLDSYAQGQLFSAYSLSRHLQGQVQAEQEFVERAAVFAARLSQRSASWEEAIEMDDFVLDALRDTIEVLRVGQVSSCGDALAALLERLADSHRPESTGLRGEVHSFLCDASQLEMKHLIDATT